MNQPVPQVTVETLTEYNEKDAIGIGLVLPHLSDNFDGSPVPKEVLQEIINSPHHCQLVARAKNGQIVGAATASITMGAGSSRNAWLQDFVVDANVQGLGVGSKLWDAAIDWCNNKGANNLSLTSHPRRKVAQAFYLKRGAAVRETNLFKKKLN